MEIVKKSSRPWMLFLLFLLSLGTICYVLFSFPPGSSLPFFGLQISYLAIFFCLLFVCLYGLSAFVLRSALQGILIATLVISFLLFRLFNLTHPFFTFLLVILFVCIEGVLWKRK